MYKWIGLFLDKFNVRFPIYVLLSLINTSPNFCLNSKY